jgi:tetratricopeptide (TPR) repeat protein
MPSFRNFLLLLTLLLPISQSAPVQARELLPQAKEPYRKGILAAQQHDFKLALRYFLDAEKADPDAPELWFNLGLASSKQAGFELRALAWFQLYLMKVPDSPKGAAIREQIGALEIAFESRMGQILDRLEPLLSSDKSPLSLNDVFYLAYARSYLGDFDGALSALRSGTGKDSWEEAIKQYPEIRNRLDNLFTPLLMNNCDDQLKWLAETGSNGVKFSLQSFDETQLPDYLRSLKTAQDPREALMTALADIGRLSVVYRVINGSFDPGRHPDAYWMKHYVAAYKIRGIYRSLGPEFTGLALEDFNRAIAMDPKSAAGYYLRGNLYSLLNNQAKAIEDSSKAIELDPKYAAAYVVRGESYSAKGEYQRAITDFSRDLELAPTAPAAIYFRRGEAYLSLHNSGKAIDDFSKTVELDPKDVAAYVKRGTAYVSLGEYCKALNDYDKALELEPNNAEALKDRDQARAEAMPTAAREAAEADKLVNNSPAPASSMAVDVLDHLEKAGDYRDLRALYDEKKGLACWIAGDEGAAVVRRLNMVRADAASTAIVTGDSGGRVLQHSIGGRNWTEEGIAVSELEKSPGYRRQMAEAIALNILSQSADAAVQSALARYRATKKPERVEEPRIDQQAADAAPDEDPSQSGAMAEEVLNDLAALDDFRDLQALYEEMETQDGWLAGAEGTAVSRRLDQLQADAAATAIITEGSERVLRYSNGGSKVVDYGIKGDDLDRSPAYRSTIADAIARNIIITPADPLVTAALERFRSSRK